MLFYFLYIFLQFINNEIIKYHNIPVAGYMQFLNKKLFSRTIFIAQIADMSLVPSLFFVTSNNRIWIPWNISD